MAKKVAGTLTPDRFVPANPEAEQAVLGSMLIDESCTPRVRLILKESDLFYNQRHAWIYQVICDLHDQRVPADFVTVCDALERRKQLDEVGGAVYVMDLINAVPTSIHAEHYAAIVEKAGVLRKIIRAAGQIAQVAYDENTPLDDVLGQVQSITFEATKRSASNRTVASSESMMSVVEGIEHASIHGSGGISTGFKMLDTLLGGGWQKGDLIICAARPSMGKTALAIIFALNAARKKHPALICSIEMPKEQVYHRLISEGAYNKDFANSRIPYMALRHGNFHPDAWEHIINASAKLGDLPLYVDDTPSPSLPSLRSSIMQNVMDNGVEIVVIDYLQLIDHRLPDSNREQAVADISRTLKGLARELQIPIIALCQLSRAVDNRQDKHARLSDLRESGSLEQDADVVIFPHRPEYYDDTTDLKGVMEIDVAKQRNGPTGRPSVFFEPDINWFRNIGMFQRQELNQ